MTTKKTVAESVSFLQEKGFESVSIAMVLGTGLGDILKEVTIIQTIPYAEIPNFPKGADSFHAGELIYGTLEGKKIIFMSGRFHLYEGYSLDEVTFPIRVLKGLGVQKLLISNAAGAINPTYNKGELMLLEDHINLQGGSPLATKAATDFGNRFVDMITPYAIDLNQKAIACAKELQITLHQGVYAAVVGPQLETRAEYRYLQIIGADAVGMSTVPEVIVANQMGISCLAISVLTDECDPKRLQAINIPEIMAIAKKAEVKLIQIIKKTLQE